VQGPPGHPSLVSLVKTNLTSFSARLEREISQICPQNKNGNLFLAIEAALFIGVPIKRNAACTPWDNGQYDGMLAKCILSEFNISEKRDQIYPAVQIY
jgi:hypothetical protein